MNSVTQKLTLEEILDLAKKVKEWKNENTYSTYNSKYNGWCRVSKASDRVTFEATKSTYGSTPEYQGDVYYKGERVATLVGKDGEKLYALVEQKINLALDEKRQRVIGELREKISPKPKQEPFYKKIGKMLTTRW